MNSTSEAQKERPERLFLAQTPVSSHTSSFHIRICRRRHVTALVVELDHLPKRLEASVVHIGRCVLDVTEGRDLEFAAVGRVTGHLLSACTWDQYAVQAVVGKLQISEGSEGVSGGQVAMAMETITLLAVKECIAELQIGESQFAFLESHRNGCWRIPACVRTARAP